MEKHGYIGAFFCKPCSPAEQYGAPCDGCALFYRSDRFDLCAEPQGDPAQHCLHPYIAVKNLFHAVDSRGGVVR